ncbi:MAG: hypothetical protein ACRDPH_02555 [Marmoricola sp.]
MSRAGAPGVRRPGGQWLSAVLVLGLLVPALAAGFRAYLVLAPVWLIALVALGVREVLWVSMKPRRGQLIAERVPSDDR